MGGVSGDRVSEVRVSEVRVSEVRVSEVRVSEVRVSEVRVSGVMVGEIGVSGVRFGGRVGNIQSYMLVSCVLVVKETQRNPWVQSRHGPKTKA